MEAYLDNSATTRCCEEAAQLVVKLLTEDYGNPSSLHNKGVIAENYMNDARKKIAKTLKVQEKEICFTSGGTESNNLAIIGVAEANKRSGKHVITTSIEHPSVSATMAYLEEHGYEVTYLPVDAYGVISLDDLKAAIRPDTILVSLMQVNNEIGAVEPIAEAGALIKQCNPQTLFHVDAIQSYGKMRIYPAKMHVDLLSVSGHKIHGPDAVALQRGDLDDLAAQLAGELLDVDLVAVLAHDVDHVDGDDNGDTQLSQLSGQIEVALEVRTVDDIQDGVGTLVDQVVTGDDLLEGVGGEGVDAGQVHDDHVIVLFQLALFLLHGDAGPVADELVRTGQGVEQRRLAAVRVARQSNFNLFFHLLVLLI